jgi:hypothetical protein
MLFRFFSAEKIKQTNPLPTWNKRKTIFRINFPIVFIPYVSNSNPRYPVAKTKTKINIPIHRYGHWRIGAKTFQFQEGPLLKKWNDFSHLFLPKDCLVASLSSKVGEEWRETQPVDAFFKWEKKPYNIYFATNYVCIYSKIQKIVFSRMRVLQWSNRVFFHKFQSCLMVKPETSFGTLLCLCQILLFTHEWEWFSTLYSVYFDVIWLCIPTRK